MMTNQRSKLEPWNKGYSKDTHPSVLKISQTLASQTKSNFFKWQQKNKPPYTSLRQSDDLAELYGVLLGDGYIEKFTRTERLIISFNFRESSRIANIKSIIEKQFGKQPSIRVRKKGNCIDVYIYQKNIAQRLGFQTGKKANFELYIPHWIKNKDEYLLKCLKGLFESDGDLYIDKKYMTHVIKFRNNGQHLLDEVYESLIYFGYHPQRRALDVRLARKKEVEDFVKKINFSKD